MKTKLLKSLLAIACLLCSIGVYAHDFDVDGIYYQIIADNEVAVTYYGDKHNSIPDEYEYTSSVVIPASVTYNDVEYTVTAIGNNAFYYSGLTEITIPSSVTSIGESAFYCCESLTNVTIPNSVTSIGRCAFYATISLTDITIPSRVIEISELAFGACYGLTTIVVEEGNRKYDSRENCNAIIETNTNTLIAGCKTTIIPNGTTSIGNYAFYLCRTLTKITIPNSVVEIGKFAFRDCFDNTNHTGLNEVVIGNSVISIGDEAFAGCNVLKKIWMKIATPPTIETWTFSTVDKSIPVYVPAESLEAYQKADYWSEFTNIITYTELEAGDKFAVDGIHYEVLNESGQVAVTYYGDDFGNITEEYKYVGEVVIPETVSYQGVNYNVTSIGDNAFYGCEGLTSITIPEGITAIGNSAFWGCSGLLSIRIETITPPIIERTTFNNNNNTISVYVPQGYAEVYRNAEYWSEFTNILEDCCIDANDAKVVKIDGVMKQEEISLPISLINTDEIAGLQCDIFLPDGLTPVMQGDKYDIVLSSRAEGFDVTAKLRNDGALRVVIVNTALDLISGNDGELFTIKLKPNEQYSTDDHIAIRNIVMTGSDYAEYEASDVVISCTIKESITGDSNCDKKVNVTDLSQMANYVAGNELGVFDADGADANQDGQVDSADIDAVSDVVVKASKAEAQNNTEVTEATENRLEADAIEIVKMNGVVVTNPISLPIALTNTATITAIQCDITVPAGLTLVVNDDVADITLSERLGESHVVKSAWLDNGALRVLIYSPTAEGIEGESGTLFTLQLQPNESYQADATIEVKNITMASTDAVEYNAMPLSISCTVKESYKGDVNRDGKVNVTDVIVTIGKVLNVYDGEFDTVAADIDQDGEITIVDAVGIINLVLDEGDTPSQARMQDDYAQGELTMQDVKMSRGETKDLVIGLTNEAPYTAFQMDVTLPAGLNIEHIALSGRADGHTLQWQVQADGSVRIVGYALDNAAITGIDGALLTLTVSSDSQFETGEVVVSNAIFSTRQLVSHRMERMTVKVSNMTSLNDVVTATRIYAADHKVVVDSSVAQEAAISTIDGMVQRVALQAGRNEIPLQQGVYIVAVDTEVKKVVIR